MYELLSEIYKELKYKTGYVYVIKVLPFKEKTGYLLSLKGKSTPPNKRRPIIIVNNTHEKIKFFAISSNKNFSHSRPKFNLKKCKITKLPDDCLGLNLTDKKINLVFAKKNKNKNFRVYYEIDIHIFDELQREGNLKYCGKCNEDLIYEAEFLIEKYFGV